MILIVNKFVDSYEEIAKYSTLLEKINDAIYIFSDGFADQFGGLMGKKMMKKRFEATLVNLQAHHMEEQKQALIAYFQNWKQMVEMKLIEKDCLLILQKILLQKH